MHGQRQGAAEATECLRLVACHHPNCVQLCHIAAAPSCPRNESSIPCGVIPRGKQQVRDSQARAIPGLRNVKPTRNRQEPSYTCTAGTRLVFYKKSKGLKAVHEDHE